MNQPKNNPFLCCSEKTLATLGSAFLWANALISLKSSVSLNLRNKQMYNLWIWDIFFQLAGNGSLCWDFRVTLTLPTCLRIIYDKTGSFIFVLFSKNSIIHYSIHLFIHSFVLFNSVPSNIKPPGIQKWIEYTPCPQFAHKWEKQSRK